MSTEIRKSMVNVHDNGLQLTRPTNLTEFQFFFFFASFAFFLFMCMIQKLQVEDGANTSCRGKGKNEIRHD